MKVGLVSPYDFNRGGIKIPPRAHLCWQRLAGDWYGNAGVTAGVNPAYRPRGVSA